MLFSEKAGLIMSMFNATNIEKYEKIKEILKEAYEEGRADGLAQAK